MDENESGLIKGKTDTLVASEVQKEKKKTKNEKAFMHGQVKKKSFNSHYMGQSGLWRVLGNRYEWYIRSDGTSDY